VLSATDLAHNVITAISTVGCAPEALSLAFLSPSHVGPQSGTGRRRHGRERRGRPPAVLTGATPRTAAPHGLHCRAIRPALAYRTAFHCHAARPRAAVRAAFDCPCGAGLRGNARLPDATAAILANANDCSLPM
jgi:hypothetical protein